MAHRRVGDHALDVRLHEGDQPGHEQRHRAEDAGELLHVDRQLEERARPRDQVDAGSDHGRRVDERADRRRALHRVG
jgi:hypothetical protein